MQRTAVIATVLAVAVSACGGTDGSEESGATVTTSAPAPETTISAETEAPSGVDRPEVTVPAEEPSATDEVQVVECAELDGPVNLAVQSVGCTVDGAPAPVSALPCEDGRTVLIAGNRFGIEGETWQPYDFATGPPVTELC